MTRRFATDDNDAGRRVGRTSQNFRNVLWQRSSHTWNPSRWCCTRCSSCCSYESLVTSWCVNHLLISPGLLQREKKRNVLIKYFCWPLCMCFGGVSSRTTSVGAVSHELIKNGYSITRSSEQQTRRSKKIKTKEKEKENSARQFENESRQSPVSFSLLLSFWFIFLVQTREKNDSCQTFRVSPKLGSSSSSSSGSRSEKKTVLEEEEEIDR